jgi:tRNA A-37 threonylcarbamoyl transferase component Bud32
MSQSGERPRFWFNGDRLRLIDDRCTQYESEWNASRSPRIEDYMGGVEGEVRTALWLELVMLDQELRRSRGDTVTIQEYQDRCPDRTILLELSTDFRAHLVAPRPRGAGSDDRLGPLTTKGDKGPPDSPGPPCIDPLLTRAPTPDDLTAPFGLDQLAGVVGQAAMAGSNGLAPADSGIGLGDYVLLEKLGQGGMGVVYKARQSSLNRIVALKMIKADMAADDRSVRRFRTEIEAVAALDHPQIVPILASGQHEGVLFYSMKLIDGRNLQESLARYQGQPVASARLIARIAEAIQHAHQRGVLHRDLKPSNILVDARGEPYVIDFGLAKLLGAM